MTDKSYTHIAIIADRSGSMRGIHTDMNGGILQLIEEQAAQPGRLRVDVTTFDTEIERPFKGAKPSEVTGEIIEPRGMTALNDALGITIRSLAKRIRKMPKGDRPDKVIVVVITDGMENASREYSLKQVHDMIDEQTKAGWTFMYLAANVDVESVRHAYGFSAGMSAGYVATASGVANTATSLSANMTRTRKGDSSGFTKEERAAALQ